MAAVSELTFRPQSEGGPGFIFREQPEADYGIDGHIEIVDQSTGAPTGKIIGVQVKAGPSFFDNPIDGGWIVYIRKATVNYWREYSVPVVMALVDLERQLAYWALVSEGSFEQTEQSYRIPVPEGQRLDASAAAALSRLATNAPAPLLAELEELRTELSQATTTELDRLRLNWREGRRRDARAWAEALSSSPARLAALEPSVASRVLRFASAILLDEEREPDRARALAGEARRRDPSANDVRLRAAFLLRDEGVQAAVELLADSAEPGDQIMRASLLARIGETGAARQVLDQIDPTGTGDRADWWRTIAWLEFAEGDLPGARAAVSEAEQQGPTYAQVRLLRATLIYMEGMAPGGLTDDLPPWPQPVRDEYVRKDVSAQSRFEAAAEEFQTLLELDWSRDERRHLQTWTLAALVAIPGGEAPAANFARHVLEADPSQPFILLWVATEGLPVDLAPHVEALQSEVEASGDIEQATILVAVRMACGSTAGLASWLDDWRERFIGAGARAEWALWRARLHSAAGEADQAGRLLEDVDAERAAILKIELLAADARRTGDSSALIDHLESLWDTTGDPQFLLQACREFAGAGRWEEVLTHLDDLLHRFPTPPVHRLAIFARYHSKDYEGCLALLHSALEHPEEGHDLEEFRRLRADTRLRIGDLPGAIADFEAVTVGPALTGDLLALVRARFLAGQTDELVTTARKLRGKPDLSSTNALMLCQMLLHDNPPLGQEFWRWAVDHGVEDEHVASAVGLGYQLGLDQELRDLHVRMVALAAAGVESIQQISIDELMSRQRDWTEERERVLDLYRRGEAATHMVAEFLREPLVHLYHTIPSSNEEQSELRHLFPLQLRDGSRSLPEETGKITAPGKLALDLSALLVAEHLDILQRVEDQFAPLRLPHLIIVALREQRGRLRPHQPSRVDVSRRLLAAERKRYLRAWKGELPVLEAAERTAAGSWWRWVALLDRARSEGAYVLDLPLEREGSPHGRPAAVAGEARLAHLVTVSDIRRNLVEAGVLNRLEHVGEPEATPAAVEPDCAAVAESQDVPRSIPSGAVIFMTDGGAEALADSDLLRAAAERYSLLVDPADQDARRASLEALPELGERAAWLDRLIQRVSDGLSNGRYTLLPSRLEAEPTPEDEGVNGDRDMSLPLRCLADLVALRSGTVDAVWIDDRSVNRHRFAGTARLVDILEVVSALEAAGRLTPDERWSIYQRLRSGNARVLPLSAAEIVHHLLRAPVVKGEIVETPALRSIRQYAAAIIDSAEQLRVPNAEDLARGQLGELEVVRGYAAAVRESLLDVWRQTADENGAEVCSSWLVHNLYLNLGLLRIRAHMPNAGEETGVSAFDAASLLVSAIPLLSDPAASMFEAGERPKAYAKWVYKTVVQARASADPEFSTALLGHLRAVLIQWSGQDSADDVERAYGQIIAGRAFDALPPNLRDRLGEDSELLSAIGRVIVSSVSLGRWDVDMAEFANAAAELLGQAEAAEQRKPAGDGGDGTVTISVLQSDPPSTLRLTRIGANALAVSSPDSSETIQVRDPAFGVLASEENDRRAACEAVRRQVDFSVSDWRRICDSIIALEQPADRFEQIATYRARALPSRYEAMRARWETDHSIRPEDLHAPDPGLVLRHLRVAPSATGDGTEALGAEAVWELAGETLISEEGVDVAFDRLTGVPVRLPSCLLEAVGRLSAPAREALARRLLRAPTSPINEVHVLRVLSWLGRDDERYLRVGRRRLRRFADPVFHRSVEVLGLVARAAHARFAVAEAERRSGSDLVDGSAAQQGELLVASWYHAHLFVSGVRAQGGDPNGLHEWVDAHVTRDEGVLFRASKELPDRADPKVLRPARFVVGGLQYAVGDFALLMTAGEALAAVLRSVAHFVEGQTLPKADLLLDLRHRSDALNTWIQPAREAGGAVVLGPFQVVSEETGPDQLRDQALSGLERDPTDQRSWITLEIAAGSDPLRGRDAERFRQASATWNLAEVISILGEAGPIAAARLAREAQIAGNMDRRDQLRQDLISLAKSEVESGAAALAGPIAPDALSDIEFAVLEALFLLAESEPSPAKAIGTFVGDLQALSRADASYLRRIRPVLERMVLERPIREAKECVGLLLEARGI